MRERTDDLTERQGEILSFISSFVDEKGYPPTRREIARAFGFKSDNAAEEHIAALARKGRLIVTSGISRGLRIA